MTNKQKTSIFHIVKSPISVALASLTGLDLKVPLLSSAIMTWLDKRVNGYFSSIQ
ncbi:MAG TPA: hypothetical protein VE710_17260 [Candidatus Bathyarchaeia archaeon]|nr:hypothetical protein [Candidatus Bathyarchaeia archaeon]